MKYGRNYSSILNFLFEALQGCDTCDNSHIVKLINVSKWGHSEKKIIEGFPMKMIDVLRGT